MTGGILLSPLFATHTWFHKLKLLIRSPVYLPATLICFHSALSPKGQLYILNMRLIAFYLLDIIRTPWVF